MEGIRIRHKTLKAPGNDPYMIIAIVAKYEKRIDPPYPACSICSLPGWRKNPALVVNHEGYKTRHIKIDQEGYAIVSRGVLEGLSGLLDHGGFDIINVISNPPTQKITMGADGTFTAEVVHKMPREIITKG